MRNRYVLLADLAGIAVAAFGALALRFDWWFLAERPEFLSFLVVAITAKPVSISLSASTALLPYASSRDLLCARGGCDRSVLMSVLALGAVLTGYVRAFHGGTVS